MKRILLVLAAGILGVAGCEKKVEQAMPAVQTTPSTPMVVPMPGATQAATVPAVRVVQAQPSGIYLRPSWTTDDVDMTRVRPMGPVGMVTLCQEPAELAYGDTDYAGVGQYFEAMRVLSRTNGMADVPYHFAVDGAGRVWQLRPMEYEGQFCRTKSAGNVGILVMGSPYAAMTPVQRVAVLKLVGMLSDRFHVPLRGVVARDEIEKVESPGEDVKATIQGIRRPVR